MEFPRTIDRGKKILVKPVCSSKSEAHETHLQEIKLLVRTDDFKSFCFGYACDDILKILVIPRVTFYSGLTLTSLTTSNLESFLTRTSKDFASRQ
jgi:hypothetical protein